MDFLKKRCKTWDSFESNNITAYALLSSLMCLLNHDLFDILEQRFRIHSVVITADIIKIYRQILFAEDRKYYQIFYRRQPNQPVKTYSLNMVTYGFASSSFFFFCNYKRHN